MNDKNVERMITWLKSVYNIENRLMKIFKMGKVDDFYDLLRELSSDTEVTYALKSFQRLAFKSGYEFRSKEKSIRANQNIDTASELDDENIENV